MCHRELVQSDNDVGNQRPGAALCELAAYPRNQRSIEHRPGAEHHQEHEPCTAGNIFRALLDREGFEHFGDILQDPVNFRGTDADAPDVDRPIRAAMQARATRLREFDQIAVRPEAGVLAEISLVEPASIGVRGEAHRARWERIGADQFTDGRLRVIRGRQRADIETEAPALRLAAIDRQNGIAQDKAADDVRSARDRLQRDRRVHLVAYPIILLVIKDRARRQDRP